MKRQSTKHVLLEHSRAKVDLLERYLGVYLNILEHVSSIDAIYLFDLMCGEGIYQDGGKGSPVVILETVKSHFFSNGRKCKNIYVYLNDNGTSDIEPDISKVDRAARYCKSIFRPKNVQLIWTQFDLERALQTGQNMIANEPRVKALYFVDPYGYKEVRLSHINEIMSTGKSELLLFLPISFMYRFAHRSLRSSFPGSQPLRRFLVSLFGDDMPHFDSVHDFITQVRDRLREIVARGNVFVDSFTIERDKSNTYSLFFFTTHELGYERMLDTKWKLDKEQGRGFSLQKDQRSLFTSMEATDFEGRLKQFFREGGGSRTNEEVRRFGLEAGYLPRHTGQVLQKWKKSSILKVVSDNGEPARGLYLNYRPKKSVKIYLSDS